MKHIKIVQSCIQKEMKAIEKKMRKLRDKKDIGNEFFNLKWELTKLDKMHIVSNELNYLS